MTNFDFPQGEEPFNLTQYIISEHAKIIPEKTALIAIDDLTPMPDKAESWSYKEVEKIISTIANELRATGVKLGDNILICLPNSSAYLFYFLAAIAAGFIPSPVSAQLTDHELDYLIKDSTAKWVIIREGDHDISHLQATPIFAQFNFLSYLENQPSKLHFEYAATTADSPAFLIYTSGTTAHPKGVLHAHRNIIGRKPMFAGWHDMRRSDRTLHAGDMNWTYSLGVGLLDPLSIGATALIFTGHKLPEIWLDLILNYDVSIFAAVPTVYRQILKYSNPAKFKKLSKSSLRHGLSAGENLSDELRQLWSQKTGLSLYESLGQTEYSTYLSTAPDVPHKTGFKGKPQKGRKVRILPVEGGTDPCPVGEAGYIAAHKSDPALMLGYWHNEKENLAVFRDDWFIGGDMGYEDEDGYISHLGRGDDIMTIMGYRLSPMEIESVLKQHPTIQEVVVLPVKINSELSLIGAYIQFKTNIVSTEMYKKYKNQLEIFVADKLAKYKQPKLYYAIDKMPRTKNGKILRRDVAHNAVAINHD